MRLINFAAIVSSALFFLANVGATPLLAAPIDIKGAGSTLVAPLMEAWVKDFEQTQSNALIHYQAIGSGGGIEEFEKGSIDFGASDVVLQPAQIEKIANGVIQVPSTAGMIVLAYNLPSVKEPLKLPQEVYADIFLGKIRHWDDPKIAAANPGVHLPSTTIAVIVRKDSSGTTYTFTTHLAEVSKAWVEGGPGVGKIVEWPRHAMLATGNEGVAGKIEISEGAIGYLEYGFARRLGLTMAVLQNKSGKFVSPTPEAGTAGLAELANIGRDTMGRSSANPLDPDAYPIIAVSWFLLHAKYPEEKEKPLFSFVDFALGKGQSYAGDLGYIVLPPPVVELAKAALSKAK